MTTKYRIQALAKYLDTPEDEIEVLDYDDCVFSVSPYRQYPSPSPEKARIETDRLREVLKGTRWEELTWQQMLEIGEAKRNTLIANWRPDPLLAALMEMVDSMAGASTELREFLGGEIEKRETAKERHREYAEKAIYPGLTTYETILKKVAIEDSDTKNLLHHILAGDEYDKWYAYAYRAAFNGEEIDLSRYKEESWMSNAGEYMVLTDEEADERAKAYIEDSLWVFNPWFLGSLTGTPDSVFEALQPQCESANETILAIVEKTCGLDKLVSDAISADGRGHFLGTYDFEENEIQLPDPADEEWEGEYGKFYDSTGGFLYIYRTN